MADLTATPINCVTMTIQLIDCEPDGVRICRVEGKSLVTVVVPRDRLRLSDTVNLPQLPNRGIYYLLDEDCGRLRRVYVGRTERGLRRISEHEFGKDFWNKAVMFLDSEANLNLEVLYPLEAKAIAYVKDHGAYDIDNTAIPDRKPGPYWAHSIDDLHADILFRMKALGYDLDDKGREIAGCEGGNLFHTTTNGIRAIGRYDGEHGRFTVLAGSEVDLNRRPKTKVATAMRVKLFGERSGKVTLTENIYFDSPSSAAEFVLGGSRNGWIEWENNQGQSLKYVYRSDEKNQGATK